VLCADGPVRSLVELTLVAEHRRGHGAMYDALAHGQVEIGRLRQALTSLPLPRAADGRIVLAVDVSPWLRSDAPTSADRLFCHVYGRGRGQSQRIPGWPYSFVAALEPGRTSWTAVLDVVRLGPNDDQTVVTAAQLRDLVGRLRTAGQHHDGDPDILVVLDAGYDVNTHQLNIANGSHHAGRAIAPDTGLDDRLLVVYRLGNANRLRLAAATLRQTVTGPHRPLARTPFLTTRQLWLETDPPMELDVDGEIRDRTPVQITLEANALRVMVPTAFTDT
jgi:hypothetical protein